MSLIDIDIEVEDGVFKKWKDISNPKLAFDHRGQLATIECYVSQGKAESFLGFYELGEEFNLIANYGVVPIPFRAKISCVIQKQDTTKIVLIDSENEYGIY